MMLNMDAGLHRFWFAIIRWVPDTWRGERMNIGILVANDERVVLRWNDGFAPSAVLGAQPSPDRLDEWRCYYQMVVDGDERREGDTMPDMLDRVRDKTENAPFQLGQSRIYMKNDDYINDVADELYEWLVLPKPGAA